MNCKLCTLKELKDMKLSLPLTFYQFEVVMGLAYSIYGGREAVEYSVKGAVAISPSSSNIRAMYGGVCENFIQVIFMFNDGLVI